MITPADTPSSPSDYAGVTPHGQGTAPYDIQAPQGDLSAAVAAAGALSGAGVVYPRGPRQAATETLRVTTARAAATVRDVMLGTVPMTPESLAKALNGLGRWPRGGHGARLPRGERLARE